MTIIEFMTYVKTAGGLAAPIFAVLFWLERAERREAQRELKEVTENSVVALAEFKALINQLTTIFGTQSRKK
ncbi:hypothetical protein [Bradyrhizobium sp. 150]|uniref:hypothetical protein n=1 Tax=Bradyrhizobium sp. 150 TaxID=2782625 RepID=UPI001FFB9E83|nr:hypothetical protein [Bradyrhizobium sp. 150]MCK1670323.1 hypothetical protein [Bradyrhizobium sp. 150]